MSAWFSSFDVTEWLQDPPLWLYLLAAIAATTCWRMLGAALIGRIDEESHLFRWVSAVAYGLVAALLMRVLVGTGGGGSDFSVLWRNLLTIALAYLGWWLGKRSIMIGMAVGGFCYYLLHL